MNKILLLFSIFVFSLIFNSSIAFSKQFKFQGNNFSDDDAIISIIGELPDEDDKTKSNYILKQLNKSGLFKTVEISFDDNNYYIKLQEYPSINNLYYADNKRIKDEEIDVIVKELAINILSDQQINYLIEELKKIYQSFGYNNIQINETYEILENNSANVYLTFKEGKITKISKINIYGNENINRDIILSKIKSKTKKITNIFANNNFKLFQINNDIIRIRNFYKSQGYKDVNIKFDIEYFENNKVEVNFYIDEGTKYFFTSLKIQNDLNDDIKLNNEIENLIQDNLSFVNSHYNSDELDDMEIKISEILENLGQQFFEISTYEKITKNNADILFQITETKPEYINQINISGNTRTYDYVIRRELDVAEGDPINKTKIKEIEKKLNQLAILGNVEVETNDINNDQKNLDISIEEIQTGSFNVGLSIDTLEGPSFLSGLKERNINGTGRSLEFLINTSDNNRAFTLSTSEKFFLNNDVNHQYSTIYKENDFSKSKSYKLNTFLIDTSFDYLLSQNLYHTIGLGYSLKDYKVTNLDSVSSNISKSSGESISFNINNELTLNTLNSFLRPTRGNYLSFLNKIETPSSSANGFMKNVVTYKKYIESKKNIFSIQSRFGNILSLNNNEILSDNKFSLGGRWLRGFDNFGAGPRNSRTDYIGANNLIVTKLDYSRPITLNDQNPIYLNFFNDYGFLWGNDDHVILSDQKLRASYGFGFNYYSPIGPIGFTWGFPLSEKDYDIKRMFLFTIGNLN